MKQITITGRSEFAHRRSHELYIENARQGLHVLMDAPGDFRNSLNERRLSAADVLITVKHADCELTETVVQ